LGNTDTLSAAAKRKKLACVCHETRLRLPPQNGTQGFDLNLSKFD
ncbi:hypothetical protein A2U01_0104866, partial [Trifolium medium]|nr:hypothetical protein [Trifolium medium]